MNTDAENTETEIVDEGQATDQVEGLTAESSTDTGDNQENKHDGVQKRINQLTAEKYQEKRAREELEAKLKEYESKAAQPQKLDESIKAPELPNDIYDDEAMRTYHKEMLEYSARVAQTAGKTAYEQQKQNETKSAQEAKYKEKLSTYAQNAISDGVDLDKLRVAEQSLNNAGISPTLGDFIMSDRNGGKIVEYLHDNPAIMHEVLAMDPVSAGIKIASEIKQRALSTTPKVSRAPEPIDDIGGTGGYVEKDDFSRKYPNTEFI